MVKGRVRRLSGEKTVDYALRSIKGDTGYKEAFTAALMPSLQGDGGFRYPEQVGKKRDDCFIGLAFHRRGREADFQGAPMHANNFVAGSLGLHMDQERYPAVFFLCEIWHVSMKRDKLYLGF